MKQLFVIFICLVSLLTACRVNNGDIGPLYGEWALRSMTVDGEEAEIDCSLYYFRFQNNIVCITVVDPIDDSVNSFGTWELDNHVLTLNFTHHNSDESTTAFTPPAALLIPAEAVTEMHVITLTASTLKMKYIAPEGQTVYYTFEKLQ